MKKKIAPLKNSPSLNQLKSTAMRAALASGTILNHYFGQNRKFKVSEKKGAGLVTDVDLASQEKAFKILKKSFPDFGLLGEESEPLEKECPGRWIIDPLDGTNNFVHGFPMFCVSIAAEWEDQIVVGVIHQPILRETYVAVRGQGAHMNGVPLRVSASSQLKNSLLTTGFTYQNAQSLNSEMRLFAELSRKTRAIRRPGSAALDLAYTARGIFDAFWERKLFPWDVAAGMLLVKEAGGQVSDFRGQPYQFDQGQILASNSKIHQILLNTIRKVSRIED